MEEMDDWEMEEGGLRNGRKGGLRNEDNKKTI